MSAQAYVASSDLARSRAFYEGVLGLEVTGENPHLLSLPGLRVILVGAFTPQAFTVAGWEPDDVTARVRELAARGVVFQIYDGMGQDADGVWTAPSGTRVAWFHDPDGNVLSLSEVAR